MPFEEMLDTLAALGYESVEIPCGNWSKAPHIDLDAMLESETLRRDYMNAIESRGLKLEALNCSGNQLAPNEEGRRHLKSVFGDKVALRSYFNAKTPEEANWILEQAVSDGA